MDHDITSIDLNTTRLLSLVDDAPPAPEMARSADDLPLAWRTRIETEARIAFQRVLAEGGSRESAIAAARSAGGAAFEQLVASADTTPDTLRSLPPPSETQEAAPSAARAPSPERGAICTAGRARSQADAGALRAAGFALQEPLYDRGTLVLEEGVANARRARAAYEALPTVSSICVGLIGRVMGENRRLIEVESRDITMLDDGRVDLGGQVYDITETGFASMCERLGYGGAGYLSKCPPALRAYNIEAQREIIETAEARRLASLRSEGKPAGARALAARIRDRAPSDHDRGGTEAFAFVSTGYPAFDADKIAEAFALAMPEDARGSVRYDASTTGLRLEALFHTTVAPEHFVAGEVFRTGIRVRSNDTGDGSITVRAIAFQNLCLNLVIIDRAGREIARLRHVGDVEDLRRAFVSSLDRAKRAIEPFLRQWGYACDEDLAARLRAEGAKIPAADAAVMRGIFAGLLAAKRVRFPRAVSGRAAALDALMNAWAADESGATARHGGVTRAAVVNAITRAAQDWIGAPDPWATDGIELDAAKLLWGIGGERPAPLPFVDEEKVTQVMEVAAKA